MYITLTFLKILKAIHRIGRTGRAGKEGIAVTFVNQLKWITSVKLKIQMETHERLRPPHRKEVLKAREDDIKDKSEKLDVTRK